MLIATFIAQDPAPVGIGRIVVLGVMRYFVAGRERTRDDGEASPGFTRSAR